VTRVKRAYRVSSLIRQELADLLLTRIKDPRLKLVTITDVKITDDLRTARVYVSVAEGRQRSASVLAGLESAMGFLRLELGHRLDLKYTPSLQFFYDESFDRAAAFNKVLKIVREDMDTSGGDPSEG
jgi:ribosome-binding factor A